MNRLFPKLYAEAFRNKYDRIVLKTEKDKIVAIVLEKDDNTQKCKQVPIVFTRNLKFIIVEFSDTTSVSDKILEIIGKKYPKTRGGKCETIFIITDEDNNVRVLFVEMKDTLHKYDAKFIKQIQNKLWRSLVFLALFLKFLDVEVSDFRLLLAYGHERALPTDLDPSLKSRDDKKILLEWKKRIWTFEMVYGTQIQVEKIEHPCGTEYVYS